MADDIFEFLAANINNTPLHQWLKPELISIDEPSSAITLRLPLRAEFRRDPNHPGIHGGIIAALVDIAGHAAVAAKLRHGVPTIDIRVDFLRMAVGEYLIASATLVKLGRSIAVVDIRITDDGIRLAAVGRGAYSTREG
jgi:uncharacterized protein (TIGR00369 family)